MQYIELENRTRNVYRFPLYRRVTAGAEGNQRTTLTLDRQGTLVLGDSADRVLPPGVARNPKCPSPIQRVTPDQLKELGEVNIQFLNLLIERGDVTQRKVTA